MVSGILSLAYFPLSFLVWMVIGISGIQWQWGIVFQLSFVCLGIFAAFYAVIAGHIAHSRARRFRLQFAGGGMAIAGFIMGYVSILATLVIVAVNLPPLMSNPRAAAQRDNCLNNMKQVGLSFRLWANDHDDQFPFNVSVMKGGTKELCDRDSDGFEQDAAIHFQVMANALNSPRILVCPSDSSKHFASDFQHLTPQNVSYQIRSGKNVAPDNPYEILVRCPIHGSVIRCDGSVDRHPAKASPK